MGDKYNFSNIQIGNNNIMNNNTYEAKYEILQDKDWHELEDFLERRLTELETNIESCKVTKQSLKYVKQRDENALKRFISSNKETFLTNVFSDVASSSLLFALGKLFL